MRALLITAGVGLAVSTALGVALAMTDARADRFEKLDQRHRACVAAVTPGGRIDARPEALCEKPIAAHWATSVRATACDQALSEKPEGLYGIRASCSLPVKTLHAARDAARANLAGVQGELKAERDSRAAVIARATASAAAQAERKARREVLDQTAPRDPDGRQRCDADCLRRRTQ